MIVTCPGCGSHYRVRNEAVPDEGAKMQCPKCRTMFLALPPPMRPDIKPAAQAASSAGKRKAPKPITGLHPLSNPDDSLESRAVVQGDMSPAMDPAAFEEEAATIAQPTAAPDASFLVTGGASGSGDEGRRPAAPMSPPVEPSAFDDSGQRTELRRPMMDSALPTDEGPVATERSPSFQAPRASFVDPPTLDPPMGFASLPHLPRQEQGGAGFPPAQSESPWDALPQGASGFTARVEELLYSARDPSFDPIPGPQPHGTDFSPPPFRRAARRVDAVAPSAFGQFVSWVALFTSLFLVLLGTSFAAWTADVIDLDDLFLPALERYAAVRPLYSRIGADDPPPLILEGAIRTARDEGDPIAEAVAWRRRLRLAPSDQDAQRALAASLTRLGAADLMKAIDGAPRR